MKAKNVKVGMEVLVKDKDGSKFYSQNLGKVGIVSHITPYDSQCTVRVVFNDGDADWGRWKDLKRVKEDSV